MTKECYLKAKEIIEHDENYPAHLLSFAYEQIEKWEFANQKVLEELEEISSSVFCRSYVENRIKELKQEYK